MNKVNVVVAERHPLMLKGICTFLNKYPELYTVKGQCLNINEAIRECETLSERDILILGEFPGFLAGTELIRWVYGKKIPVKIVTYFEHTPFLKHDSMLNAGAKGFVWKGSHPACLNRALDAVSHGYAYCDDSDTESGYLLPRQALASDNYLTTREREIVQLIVDGKTNKEIARYLHLSNKTVETHRLNLMKKLDVHSGIELLKRALRMGVCTI